MATKYAAQGSVVSATYPWTKVKISAVANTTPIELTTLTAHHCNQTDTIDVEGTGISAIDGQEFQVNVVDSTHIQLLGTSASGTSSTGYVLNYQLQPAGSFPSGGDLGDPNVVGAALEWAGNPGPFLYKRCGQYSFFQGYYAITSPGNVSGNYFMNLTWGSALTPAHSWTMLSYQTLQAMGGGVAPYVKGSDALSFESTFTIMYTVDNSNITDAMHIAFGLFLVQGGSLVVPSGGSPFAMTFVSFDSTRFANTGGGANDYFYPIVLRGFIPNLTTYGAGGGLSLPASNLGIGVGYYLDNASGASGSSTLQAVGNWTVSGAQYRAN